VSDALFTDLYELTMADAYLAEGMEGTAVFELFFRRLPPDRNFAIAAGLDGCLDFLEHLRFEEEDVAWLRRLGRFSDRLLDALAGFRFHGDVWAMPEGTPVFPNEPLLQVVAPILEAQLVETALLARVHVETLIASKAARIVHAARGRMVVDFGARRAHGFDAAFALARSSWLVGAAGTSLVAAGRRWGIPIFGTMAHSYVQAHDTEREAFERFARIHPGTTILVDTWDTLEGVRKVVSILEADPDLRIDAIRLDSGDLAELAIESRRILDEAGLGHVRIFASSDLDEWAIEALLERGAPIDGFGVGTRMATSLDAPSIDVVYKLVEYDGVGRAKLSTTKVLHPGRKQVFREEADGVYVGDTLARHDERCPGTPLLRQVMKDGRRLEAGREPLEACRARALDAIARLPPALRGLEPAGTPYPVRPTRALVEDLDRIRAARH